MANPVIKVDELQVIDASKHSKESQEFISVYNRLLSRHKQARVELGEVDQTVNECYHVIELIDVSAAEAVRLMFKTLRPALRQRRALKEELIGIQNTLSAIGKIQLTPCRAQERREKYLLESEISRKNLLKKD